MLEMKNALQEIEQRLKKAGLDVELRESTSDRFDAAIIDERTNPSDAEMVLLITDQMRTVFTERGIGGWPTVHIVGILEGVKPPSCRVENASCVDVANLVARLGTMTDEMRAFVIVEQSAPPHELPRFVQFAGGEAETIFVEAPQIARGTALFNEAMGLYAWGRDRQEAFFGVDLGDAHGPIGEAVAAAMKLLLGPSPYHACLDGNGFAPLQMLAQASLLMVASQWTMADVGTPGCTRAYREVSVRHEALCDRPELKLDARSLVRAIALDIGRVETFLRQYGEDDVLVRSLMAMWQMGNGPSVSQAALVARAHERAGQFLAAMPRASEATDPRPGETRPVWQKRLGFYEEGAMLPPFDSKLAARARRRERERYRNTLLRMAAKSMPGTLLWKQAFERISEVEESLVTLASTTGEGERNKFAALYAAGAAGDETRRQDLIQRYFQAPVAALSAGKPAADVIGELMSAFVS